MYDLNIVIVNWKAKRDIESCLISLFRDLENSNLNFIVQVVDNSENRDGIKELISKKFPEVKYLDSGGNIGFGRAQNLGLISEEARFYLPLNPDIYFKKEGGAIKKLIDVLEQRSEVGMLAPRLLNSDGSVQYSCCRFPGLLDQIGRRMNWDEKNKKFKEKINYYLIKNFNHNKKVSVDWIMGSFMLVKNEVVREVGFFDDRFFMYFEDCDWCRRVWKGGWQVFYCPEVEIIHKHKRDSATEKPFLAIFKNSIARAHLKSWFKYFKKWGIKKDRFGI
ncbi:glycosyltransferase family 2 protein [bacterium]|nr:glycosyltransferase family 2 protein [bacterium]